MSIHVDYRSTLINLKCSQCRPRIYYIWKKCVVKYKSKIKWNANPKSGWPSKASIVGYTKLFLSNVVALTPVASNKFLPHGSPTWIEVHHNYVFIVGRPGWGSDLRVDSKLCPTRKLRQASTIPVQKTTSKKVVCLMGKSVYHTIINFSIQLLLPTSDVCDELHTLSLCVKCASLLMLLYLRQHLSLNILPVFQWPSFFKVCQLTMCGSISIKSI